MTAVAVFCAGATVLFGCWGGGNDPADTPTAPIVTTPSVPVATPTRAYPNATPLPGETPDPSNPESLVMWLNRDSLLPRVDTVVAGIAVGPGAERSGGPCGTASPVDIDFSEARDTRVDVTPGYLLPGAELESSQAVRCGGDVAFAMLTYRLPVASDLRERLAAGESYWDIPRGGSVEIIRFIGDPAENVGLPAERWEERSIVGLPAAVGHPVLDEGLGEGYVLVHADGVLTVVRTGNVSLAELLRIAEGVITLAPP